MTFEEAVFKLSKLQRIAIVVAVTVLLQIGIYFMFISDNLTVIDSLKTAITRIKADIQNEENIKRQGPKLEADIKRLKDRLQTMVASLPEKQDIEALLRTVTQLLSESNLIAQRFVPGQEQVNYELYYARIPINMSVVGDYQKIGSFLASLNDLPRIVNVPSIRLGKGSTGSAREKELAAKLDIIQLGAEVQGETFRRLSQAEIKRIQSSGGKKSGRRGRRRR